MYVVGYLDPRVVAPPVGAGERGPEHKVAQLLPGARLDKEGKKLLEII